MISHGQVTRAVLFACAVIATTACGSDSNLPYLLSCDVSASPCQTDIYASLAPLLHADPADLPEVRVISPDAFRQEILDGSSAFKLPAEEPETRAFELMRLTSESERDVSLDQLDFWVADVTGYFDSGVITIIDRAYEPGFAQFLLAHEFVHAIQERDFDLDGLAAATTRDELLAKRSVVEGDADYFAHDWYYHAQQLELVQRDWNDINAQRKEILYELAADVESSAFDAASFFPYALGMAFVRWAINREGFVGRSELFTMLPESSRDVFEIPYVNGRRVSVAVEPLENEIPPPMGYDLVASERLGAWFVFVYLRRLGPESEAGSHGGWNADGQFMVPLEGAGWGAVVPHLDWRNDRLSVYQKDGTVTAVWHLRLRNDRPPQRDVDLVLDLVGGSSGPGAWSARQTGEHEVAVIFAEDEATLATWEAQPVLPAGDHETVQPKRRGIRNAPGPFCVETATRR